MAAIKVVETPHNFECRRCVRVQQGEVFVGKQAQLTLLRSCVCIGFYHAKRRLGAISHITGFQTQGGHSPAGALQLLTQGLRQHGLLPDTCQCFLIGGDISSAPLYQSVCALLKKEQIPFEPVDVLGHYHRKILLDPAEGVLTLFKRTHDAALVLPHEQALKKFNDPRQRITTGASVFFRNNALLKEIRTRILAESLRQGNRFHVWCAGCSVGMEVYSVAMITLDWLSFRKSSVDFKVLGTDISEDALRIAVRGEYAVMRENLGSYQRLLDRYTYSEKANAIRVGDALRRVSIFKHRDIREGSRRHRFELVICDHVLQYFPPEIQRVYIASLVRALQPQGYLYVSTASPMVAQAIPQEFGVTRFAKNWYRRNSGETGLC